MKDRFIAAGLAGLIALAVGCSRGSDTPTTPSAAVTPEGAALPDGSTLKATAPSQVSPTGGGRIDTTRPNLIVGKSNGRHVAANFQYVFEISTPGGTVVHTSPKVSGGDQISYNGANLNLDTRYRWRARAEMGAHFGPWSNYAEFVTIDYRGLVPRPANGQWPSNGSAVVAYVAASFPERLRPTGNLNDRIHNMEFLRDRIIETAICGGMDVAWNNKRNIGPHSHDAVAWRTPGGRVAVMDIASGFDDFGASLSLHWLEVAGPSGYDTYTNHPGC